VGITREISVIFSSDYAPQFSEVYELVIIKIESSASDHFIKSKPMKKQSSCNDCQSSYTDCHGEHSFQGQGMNMNMEMNPFPISATVQEIQERESLIKQFGYNWSTFILDSAETASTFHVTDRKFIFSTLDCSSHSNIVPMNVEDGSEYTEEDARIFQNAFGRTPRITDSVRTSYYDASLSASVVSLDIDFPVEHYEKAEDVPAQRGGHQESTVQRC
jgi:hypothetical protein